MRRGRMVGEDSGDSVASAWWPCVVDGTLLVALGTNFLPFSFFFFLVFFVFNLPSEKSLKVDFAVRITRMRIPTLRMGG